MTQYGLISKVDAATIEKTLSLIIKQFPSEVINITEVGLFNCQTSIAIHEYLKDVSHNYTGIDNEKDKPIVRPGWMNFIKGNSTEVYNQLKDESQHLIFIDANHTFPSTIADFFCYQDKVKPGGYIAFHDTGAHIKPFTGYQLMGSEADSDMYIACRKALKKIGLLNNRFCGSYGRWRLVFDEADENDEMGGVCVFKKIKLWE
jgi:hypothetical protein